MSTRRAKALPALVMPEVADFRYDGDGHYEGDPAHRLESGYDGRHRPVRQQLLDLLRQPIASGLSFLDSMNVVLPHDLLSRMLEAHRRQPASVSQGPGASPAVNPLMAQQEALQMLARFGQHPNRGRPCPHQIPHRLCS